MDGNNRITLLTCSFIFYPQAYVTVSISWTISACDVIRSVEYSESASVVFVVVTIRGRGQLETTSYYNLIEQPIVQFNGCVHF